MHCRGEITFGHSYIKYNLTQKYESAVEEEVINLYTIFDIEESAVMLSQYEFDPNSNALMISQNDRIKWETKGQKEFKHFYKKLCSLPHILRHVQRYPELDLLCHWHDVVHLKYKETLKDISRKQNKKLRYV